MQGSRAYLGSFRPILLPWRPSSLYWLPSRNTADSRLAQELPAYFHRKSREFQFLLHLSCEIFSGIKKLPEPALRVKSDPKRGVLTPKSCSKAAGNETLIRSPDCGSLNLTANTDSQQSLAAFNSVDVNDTLAATTYSRACYGGSQSLLQCTQYPQQQLPWKITQNATCPFTHDICIDGVSSAYEMDSGPIDSHDALGINAPNSERVQYRKVTTCKLAFQPFMPNPYRTRVAGHVRGAD